MNWLKDFFFCDTWGDLVLAAVLGGIGIVILWALIFMAIILFG
jgi:hypothetical protein